MSRIAFLTRVFARSHVVPPRRSSGGLRRAGVFLQEVEALDGNEQLVLAGVPKLEELLRRAAVGVHGNLPQADEHADAVIDVDDEVADLEVAEIGEERAGRGAAAVRGAALLLEDVGLGEDLQRRLRQAEAARQAAGGDEQRGGVRHLGARLHGVAPVRVHEDGDGDQVVVAQDFDGALGAARRGGDEQHGLPRQPPALDLLRPIGHAPAELDGGLAGEGLDGGASLRLRGCAAPLRPGGLPSTPRLRRVAQARGDGS